MKRRRFKTRLEWWEPVCFARRGMWRAFIHIRLHRVLIRCTLIGYVLSIACHLYIHSLGVPLPLPTWKYYMFAAAVPGMLFVQFAAHMLVPRAISMRRALLTICHGQAATPVQGRDIIEWRFRALRTDSALIILRIRYRNSRGKVRCTTLGLSRKVNPVDVDRCLRRMGRYDRLKRRRREQPHTQPMLRAGGSAVIRHEGAQPTGDRRIRGASWLNRNAPTESPRSRYTTNGSL